MIVDQVDNMSISKSRKSNTKFRNVLYATHCKSNSYHLVHTSGSQTGADHISDSYNK